MLHGAMPFYLSNHIELILSNNYDIRLSQPERLNIMTRRYRLSTCSSQNSFFSRSSKLWNELPLSVKQSSSLMLFKTRLKMHFSPELKKSQPWHYHNLFQGKIGRLLMQIALGPSPLKSHLFKYNITDNLFCQLCKLEVETRTHYLCTCSVLRALSNKLRVNVND